MSEQSSKWHATRNARIKELIEGKHYVVVEEFKSGQPIETPLGYKVKSGWYLEDSATGAKIAVGKSLMNTLADADVVEKPAPKKRGRPRKSEPLAQAEEWASRDIPDDAQQITQAGPTYTNPNAGQEF